MLNVAVFFGLIAGSFALVYIDGNCPDVTPKGPVSLDQIVGDWWAVLRDDNSWDLDGKCVLTHFDPPVDGVIRARGSRISASTNDFSTIESNVTLGPDKVLEFRHHLPVWGDFDQDQFILDSDPNRYAVVYSCRNYRYRYVEKFWVFARPGYLNGYYTNGNFLKQVLDSYGLSSPNWVKVDNENCN